MNTFLDVVRADDLLVLRFELVNLVLDPDESAVPRRLVRAAADREARLVVHFPPQHLAEECLRADAVGHVGGLAAASTDRVRALLAGGSRLAFRVPADMTSLPFTLDGLLAWHRLEPALAVDTEAPGFDRPEFIRPTGEQTAIEMPFRLHLSPSPHDRWFHSAPPRGGRSELWHTRLGPLSLGQQRGLSLVRAVWSPDRVAGPSAEDLFPLSLTPRQRSEIVRLSSDFRILALDKFVPLEPDEVDRLPRYEPVPLRAERVILSALGGWLRVRSAFDFPLVASSPLLAKLKGQTEPPHDLFDLAEWTHDLAMGRDLQVQTVSRGFLYPLGHEAHVVTMTRRRLSELAESLQHVAFLEQRQWLLVVQRERDYPTGHFPFRHVRIATEATPPLDGIEADAPFVPQAGGGPIAFAAHGVDHAGRHSDFELPLVFVPATQVADLAATRALYEPDGLGAVGFAGQPVAYAPETARRQGSTTLVTEIMKLQGEPADSEVPPFLPRVASASVHLPAVEQLLGGDRTRIPTQIEYHPKYVNGAGPDGVFARLKNALPLAFPADKGGGVAAPTLSLAELSADHGAMTHSDILEGLEGKLLGVVDLRSVIQAATGVADRPKVTMEGGPDGQRARFEWTARLKNPTGTDAFVVGADSKLVLKGQIVRSRDGGVPSTDVEGTLTRFALKLAGVVRVDFDSLRFHMVSGRKPEFDAKVTKFTFEGALKWLQVLSTRLQDAGNLFGGSGPALAVTPAGITASIAMPLPNLTLTFLTVRGIFASAALRLFFDGRAAELEIGLCSPQKPFLVAYTVFGGGGSLLLTARTDGTLGLRASLEFGAVAAVDLVLAKGLAQVMVAVAFSMHGTGLELKASLRIHGSVEVLGIVSVSVDFTLELKYQDDTAGSRLVARGELVVQVRVLGFARSVTLAVERGFDLTQGSERAMPPGGRTVAALAEPAGRSQWEIYRRAFA
ncbi:MAG: hypothetical protein ABW221_03380 [Vicinamibacteria bacterium]